MRDDEDASLALAEARDTKNRVADEFYHGTQATITPAVRPGNAEAAQMVHLSRRQIACKWTQQEKYVTNAYAR
jgi:hypothetical protein